MRLQGIDRLVTLGRNDQMWAGCMGRISGSEPRREEARDNMRICSVAPAPCCRFLSSLLIRAEIMMLRQMPRV
jgi:hypothetical protein